MVFSFSLELLSAALGFMVLQIRFLEDRLDLSKRRLTECRASMFLPSCVMWGHHPQLSPPPPPSKTNLLQARPDLRFGHVLNAVISFFPYTSKVTKSQYIEVYAGICESRLLKGWFTWCS